MNKHETRHNNTSDDLLALKLLENFLPVTAYLPYTSSSLSFNSIRLIANDIVIHQRKNILEFGSGISTIILGKLIQELDVNARLISIDENKDWVNIINHILHQEKITSVTVIHQELNYEASNEDKYWYLQNELQDKINQKSNMIIVDGPSAWQMERTLARKPALSFLLRHNLLDSDNFSIYLDDCNRNGENQILEDWATLLNCKKSLLTTSLGRISKNDKFNLK